MALLAPVESSLSIDDAVSILDEYIATDEIYYNSMYTLKIFADACIEQNTLKNIESTAKGPMLIDTCKMILEVDKIIGESSSRDPMYKPITKIFRKIVTVLNSFNNMSTYMYFHTNSLEIVTKMTIHEHEQFSLSLDVISGVMRRVCEFWIALDQAHIDKATHDFVDTVLTKVKLSNDPRITFKFK